MPFPKIIIAALLLAQPAGATVYYVDNSVGGSGNDANNGTNPLTPWKHPPTQDSVTPGSVAANTVLTSGDIVYWKTGLTHILDGTISLKYGVTYDGKTWGGGAKAILDGQIAISKVFLGATNVSNWTVRGFQCNNIGGLADEDPVWTSGVTVAGIDFDTDVITTVSPHGLVVGDDVCFNTTGTIPVESGLSPHSAEPRVTNKSYVIATPTTTTFQISATAGGASRNITSVGTGTLKVWEPVSAPRGGSVFDARFSGCNNFLIDDVDAYKVGQWRRLPPMSGTQSVTGAFLLTDSNSGVTVRNCDIVFCKNPFAIKVSGTTGVIQNVLIEDCTVNGAVWGVDFAPYNDGATIRDITVRRCTFTGFAYYDRGNWLGFGDKPHTDHMFLRTSTSFGPWINILVDSCKFYEDDTENSKGGTACIYISEGPSVRIQNSLFLNVEQTNGCIGFNGSASQNGTWYQNVEILNNTFVTRARQIRGFTGTAPWPDRVIVKNNIMWRMLSSSIATNIDCNPNYPTDVVEWNRNIYWNNTPDPAASSLFSTPSFRTFASWKSFGAARSVDVDSNVVQPLLVSTSGPASTWDLRPLAGSWAIGNGEDLSAYFTHDYSGATRTGAWTIGAYHADGGVPPDVTAPTLPDAFTDTTGGTVSLVFSEPVQGVDLAHYSVSGHTLSGLTGSGTNWTFNLSPVRSLGANFTFGYTSGAGRTRDLAGNLFATGTYTIRNNSLAETPNPATPGRRGATKGRAVRR